MLKLSFVKSAILAVLVALVTCGFSTSAFAKPSKPVVVHPGDAEVEVDNDGEVDVDLGDSPSKPDEDGPAIMQDDFTAAKKAKPEPVDTDSVIEIALRGVVVPGTGPALGGTLGFSWRPANRYRVYGGFNGSKGLIDLSGQEKELFQFGFTVGGSYAITRTVEIGLFGNMSWAYRDLTKDISASFVGIGPGFRINKSHVFFEASVPIGAAQKFTGNWEMRTPTVVSVGFHF